MSEGKNVFESFREVAQDLLVPELKAVKVSVDSLRIEMKMTTDALREEMKFRLEAMEKSILESNERLVQLIRHSDERNDRAMLALAEKLDGSMQIRERLATLEA